MRDLTPVRLSGAGALLVLTDGNGVEYAVPVASLQETLGRAGTTQVSTAPAPPHSGPQRGKEPTMESSLRPRDIQSRIRAGESAEDVAAVAGTSVEKVMIFASPVLAERAHVAQGAESASVRRVSPDPTSPAVATSRSLGAAVACRLREQGVDPASVAWDAWRREDGRWTLQAGYLHDEDDRRARFSFDQRGHYVAADDDEARWLVGDGQVPARAVAPAAPAAVVAAVPEVPAAAPALRLAPSLGDDTLDLFTPDADWMGTVSRPDETPVVHPEPEFDPAAPVDEPTPEEEAQEAPDPAVDEQPAPARPVPRPATKKARGRASVPSWDEIMFGGGK